MILPAHHFLRQYPPGANPHKFEPPVAPYGMENLPAERVVIPMTFPLLGNQYRWRDDYNEVRNGFRHTGLDMQAPKMTPIVAPFSGTIGFKKFSFWIYGDNGWRCLGTHLNEDTPGTNDKAANWDYMFAPNIRYGGHVEEGQLIGYVGSSRGATGPHLHFEIYGPNGIRDPFSSLKAARHISAPTYVAPQIWPNQWISGADRVEGCIRGFTKDSVTVLIVAQHKNGSEPAVATYPKWVRMSYTPSAGFDPDVLRLLPTDLSVRFVVRPTSSGLQVVMLNLPEQKVRGVKVRQG